ncbi:MAG: TnpV protein, partial [Oscillospiraceae bacterium]|nr:TnpV protein [Oscillospiraceae bacterium]
MAELTYTRMGDYLIPDLTLDSEDDLEEYPLGKYGRLRETFLKEHHHGTYT